MPVVEAESNIRATLEAGGRLESCSNCPISCNDSLTTWGTGSRRWPMQALIGHIEVFALGSMNTVSDQDETLGPIQPRATRSRQAQTDVAPSALELCCEIKAGSPVKGTQTVVTLGLSVCEDWPSDRPFGPLWTTQARQNTPCHMYSVLRVIHSESILVTNVAVALHGSALSPLESKDPVSPATYSTEPKGGSIYNKPRRNQHSHRSKLFHSFTTAKTCPWWVVKSFYWPWLF